MISKMDYTPEKIVSTLSNLCKIRESAYYGAVENVDIVMDIELLLRESNLTERQLEILDMYYLKQYTQEEVSEELKISQQAVLDHLNRIKGKLKQVLIRWEEKQNDKE